MQIIRARNVNDALVKGVELMRAGAVRQASRNGATLEYPEPVCTLYERPAERVLFDKVRDANPFFHLLESLWMLEGRRDVAWLARILPRMADYSDDGKVFNAAYGYRWRNQFSLKAGGGDQLTAIVELLRRDHDTRRAVLQIWDASADLAVNSKDLACNTQAMFKVRDGKLNMLVSNRSNDMVWGCYGANAVHFSVMQEYVAARVGVALGAYRQVSDSFHAYEDTWGKVSDIAGRYEGDPYEQGEVSAYPLAAAPEDFDAELHRWFENPPDALNAAQWEAETKPGAWKNPFFPRVATPMYRALFAFKDKDREGAHAWLDRVAATDWQRAGREWLQRRKER
ncbi:MAG: hypothetical protein JNJ73_11520 [Hyphomonadaceae bacterium]|nr:hypothetical protein [Hyphomonadaceae bacterium]